LHLKTLGYSTAIEVFPYRWDFVNSIHFDNMYLFN
jgi:hypothetical protein